MGIVAVRTLVLGEVFAQSGECWRGESAVEGSENVELAEIGGGVEVGEKRLAARFADGCAVVGEEANGELPMSELVEIGEEQRVMGKRVGGELGKDVVVGVLLKVGQVGEVGKYERWVDLE